MTQRPVVLLVDDDASVRQSLARALSCENFGIVVAANGEEALRGLEENLIDVVLLDQDLGQESGWDTLEELRKLQPGLPVIIMTARPRQRPAHSTQDVEALVEKPLDLSLLFRTLGSLAGEAYKARLLPDEFSRRADKTEVALTAWADPRSRGCVFLEKSA